MRTNREGGRATSEGWSRPATVGASEGTLRNGWNRPGRVSPGQSLCEGNRLVCVSNRNEVGDRIIKGGKCGGRVGEEVSVEGRGLEGPDLTFAVKRIPARERIVGARGVRVWLWCQMTEDGGLGHGKEKSRENLGMGAATLSFQGGSPEKGRGS